MSIELILYTNETASVTSLITQFWQAHNNHTPDYEDILADLSDWTKTGHQLYLIRLDGNDIGFVHLGSRGCEIDWLEDIFVLPEFQGRGIGTCVIQMIEDMVKEYSESLYIEAAARNEKAIRLYQRIGYSCLNTITIRKDFHPEKQKKFGTEQILGMQFEIRE